MQIKKEKDKIADAKIEKCINDCEMTEKLLRLEAPKVYRDKFASVLATKMMNIRQKKDTDLEKSPKQKSPMKRESPIKKMAKQMTSDDTTNRPD